jgi:hypothetical protein
MPVEMNFGPCRVTVARTLSVLFAIGCLFHDVFTTARPIYSKKMKYDRTLGAVQEELPQHVMETTSRLSTNMFDQIVKPVITTPSRTT